MEIRPKPWALRQPQTSIFTECFTAPTPFVSFRFSSPHSAGIPMKFNGGLVGKDHPLPVPFFVHLGPLQSWFSFFVELLVQQWCKTRSKIENPRFVKTTADRAGFHVNVLSLGNSRGGWLAMLFGEVYQRFVFSGCCWLRSSAAHFLNDIIGGLMHVQPMLNGFLIDQKLTPNLFWWKFWAKMVLW